MNIGMNVPSINLFEGGILGTFFDFDQDGIHLIDSLDYLDSSLEPRR